MHMFCCGLGVKTRRRSWVAERRSMPARQCQVFRLSNIHYINCSGCVLTYWSVDEVLVLLYGLETKQTSKKEAGALAQSPSSIKVPSCRPLESSADQRSDTRMHSPFVTTEIHVEELEDVELVELQTRYKPSASALSFSPGTTR